MFVMRAGITYEKNKVGTSVARRFYECKKCHDKVYFHSYLNKSIEKIKVNDVKNLKKGVLK